MVSLPLGYCIDSTEVTQGQYQAWLDTEASTSKQIAVCSSNTFTPSSWCTIDPSVCQGSGCDNYPQVCVDWCDAYAYCAAVGKRLCGKIGGGSNDWADVNDVTKSQWYAACTSNGVFAYPYGEMYDAASCNGYDYWGTNAPQVLPVASMSKCQSPATEYAGVYDLSGNVWEWDDTCVVDPNFASVGPAGCRPRGGYFGAAFQGGNTSAAKELRCDDDDFGSPLFTMQGASLGFRCCAP
jgi:formylglycine-generating enzyme required for sulfatase activity